MFAFRWPYLVGAWFMAILLWVQLAQHGIDLHREGVGVLVVLNTILLTGHGYYKFSGPLALFSVIATVIAIFFTAWSVPLLLAVILAAIGVWLLQPKRSMAPESCPQEGAK